MDVGRIFGIGFDALIYSYVLCIYTIILRIAEYQVTLHDGEMAARREQ